MKCSQCGYTKFEEVRLPLSEGGWVEETETYACLKCGHIELFISDLKLTNIHRVKDKEKELKKCAEELKIKKEELNKIKVELMSVIEDESSTVKAVKESKIKLEEINKELEKKSPFGN